MFIALAKGLVRVTQSAIFRFYPEHISHAFLTAEVAIVIGNGPSLTEDTERMLELARLNAGRLTFYCVNNFPGTDLFFRIRPGNLVLADHAFWSTDVRGKFEKTQKDLLQALKNPSRDFDVTIFFPSIARSSRVVEESFRKLPRIKLFFYNPFVWRFNFLREYLQSKNLAAPQMQNVMIAALYIALLRRTKTIYTFGLEQSFHLSTVLRNDNVLCFKYRRFYGDTEIFPFYKDPSETSIFTVKEFFQVMVATFESFEQIEKLSRRLRAKIINLTSNTFVDTFVRKDL